MPVKKNLFFIVIALIFLLPNLSCHKITGKPPLSKEQFSMVYTDYMLAVAQKEAKMAGAAVDSIFKHHIVETNEFKKTLQYYMKNPNQWEEMMNLISKELEKRSHELESAKIKELQATQKPPDTGEAQPILE